MGHLAAGPNKLREVVNPGALEKSSPGTGAQGGGVGWGEDHPLAEGKEIGLGLPPLLSVLAAEGKKSARS